MEGLGGSLSKGERNRRLIGVGSAAAALWTHTRSFGLSVYWANRYTVHQLTPCAQRLCVCSAVAATNSVMIWERPRLCRHGLFAGSFLHRSLPGAPDSLHHGRQSVSPLHFSTTTDEIATANTHAMLGGKPGRHRFH
eukprot:1293731-Rhodomonas_salina.2